MSETAPPDLAAVRSAIETIERVANFEKPLRRRTEGATWMVWGLTVPAIALSYHAVPELLGDQPPLESPLYYGLWLPWILAAAATTYAIWRIAGVATPQISVPFGRHAVQTLVWAGIAGVTWAASWFVSPNLTPDTSLLLALGTTWALFGAIGLFRLTETGRRVCLGIGLTLLVAGLVLAYAQPADVRAADVQATFGLVAVASLAPLAGGLFQVVRG